MMRTWGAYVHYLLRGLGRLPSVACDVFRGYARPTQPPFQAPSIHREYRPRTPRCLLQAAYPSLSVFGYS